MKVINTSIAKKVIEIDNPYAYVSAEPEKFDVVRNIVIHTVELEDAELIKVKQVLFLSPKQYKKFVKKFKLGEIK